MPSVKLSKKTVLDLVGKKLTDKELTERIPMLGTDLDEVTDTEISVEIFPNRPDLLSEQGFARALSSFLGINIGLRKYVAKKSNYKMIIESSVKTVRPYTACAVVKNLKFNDEKIKEIIQIQEKLHVTFGRNRKRAAIGIYPMEHIKFPIYFKADDPNKIKFQPLEYPRELTALQILSMHPTGRDYGHLLEGLDKFPYFIDANNNILSLPPVINSHNTGRITDNTSEVFIECSGFEKHVLNKCLNMIVTALADMGGEIYEITVENKHEKSEYILPDLKPEEMTLNLEYTNKVLGLNLTKTQAKECLEKMGYGVTKDTVLVPAYRSDVIDNIDLVEDIAIAYGFENFEPIIPKVSTIGKEDPIEIFKQKIREVLAGFGLYETKTYNISSSAMQTEYMNVEIPIIKLANSLTIDFDCLRAWVTPSLMAILKQNKSYEYPQSYFDFGRVFKKTGEGETGITESERLSVVLCGPDFDFTKIKQILDAIFVALGKEYDMKSTKHDSFIPGRVGRVSYENKEIAYMGEIHPQILENFELEMPVAALELNITDLFELVKEEFY
ncbi:phenylalanine--tRNA ligase subunit beta [Candidatus Woesearchaeota archaeon]|nr:phenylalanine--tRNA ligase subunit beta [Candidatus Woesearchaeota archaeon]